MRLRPLTCLCLVGERSGVRGHKLTCFCCSSTLLRHLHYLNSVPPHNSQLLTSSFPSLLLSDNHASFQEHIIPVRDAQYLYQYPSLIQLLKTHLNFLRFVAYQKRSSIATLPTQLHRRRMIIHSITSPQRVTIKCPLLNGVLVWVDIVTKLCTIAIYSGMSCEGFCIYCSIIFFFCLYVQQIYGGRKMLK